MRVILNGGGCGDKTKDIYSLIDDIIDNTKPILCIPLAREKDDSGYENSRQWLKNELADIHYSELVMADSSEQIADLNLSDFGLIYISGGNTYKLLAELKRTSAFDKIKNYIDENGVVYGSSAGAAICGFSLNSIEYADKNEVGLQDIGGYDLLSGLSVAAHYTNKSEEKTKIATEFLTNLSLSEPVIALPEEDSIFINDDKITVVGNRDYYIFKNGLRTVGKLNLTMSQNDIFNQ